VIVRADPPPFLAKGRTAVRNGGKSFLILVVLAAALPVWAQPFTIHWRTESRPAAVEVEGFTPESLRALERTAGTSSAAEWQRMLAVFAQQEDATMAGAIAMPPMAGTWSVQRDRLRFEPRFPLAAGVRYRAEFVPAGGAPVVSYFQLPADNAPPSTRVVQVFPSAAKLPENQLKFYIQFSAPMSRRSVYEHVRLRQDGGDPIELPFLELDEELWDPAMTRLTLLIDPGRIKRGVKPQEDEGAVFEVGKSYTLTIGADCRDAAGRPLREAFEKKIQIVAADRVSPDPKRWKVVPPASGTRDGLVVDFDEPLDHALALRLLARGDGRRWKKASG
jgi:hypothetical protein